MGRVREEKESEKKKPEKRKSQKKEDQGRKVAKHSNGRLANAAGAEPPGGMRDQRLHAVVA